MLPFVQKNTYGGVPPVVETSIAPFASPGKEISETITLVVIGSA
jgi:hypothetical protein